MQNNYFFLRQLSRALRPRLESTHLLECFSQNKDELILRFASARAQLIIKASLLPSFSCLSFPPTYQRTGKNSIDLFQPLIGRSVLALYQYNNERSFRIDLDGAQSLLFKMHGSQSNILRIEQGAVAELFRNNLKSDWNLSAAELDRPINWTEASMAEHATEIRKYFSPLGAPAWRFLDANGFKEKSIKEQWEMIDALLKQIDTGHYYEVEQSGLPVFLLFPFGKPIARYSDPVEALNDFFTRRSKAEMLQKERNAGEKAVRDRLRTVTEALLQAKHQLAAKEADNHFRSWADLLMAHLSDIPAGASEASLPSFEDPGATVTIPVKPGVSPQKMAELYYRKARNGAIEKSHLQERINQKEKEREHLEYLLRELEHATDLKGVRKLSDQLHQTALPARTGPSLFPYREVVLDGFRVWIGRNASANDELTLKYSTKNDLWLHARDVPGSHVVIKHQSGKPFPKNVIEQAASLAAYYSKRRTDTLVPVSITEKKYVRKRKGAPPGTVVLDRETVWMVRPAAKI